MSSMIPSRKGVAVWARTGLHKPEIRKAENTVRPRVFIVFSPVVFADAKASDRVGIQAHDAFDAGSGSGIAGLHHWVVTRHNMGRRVRQLMDDAIAFQDVPDIVGDGEDPAFIQMRVVMR